MRDRLVKKGLVLGIITLFIGVSIVPCIGGTVENLSSVISRESNSTLNKGTLYVGGSGPNNYTTIQDAIDDSSDGDTVFVYNDSSPYNENLLMDKSISLIGENKETTIIDGTGTGYVLEVDASNTVICNMTITNSGNGDFDAGIYFNSDSNNNEICFNIISSNQATGCKFTKSSNNEIHHNIISNNAYDGLGIRDDSNDNSVYENMITNNGHDGIFVYKSSANNIGEHGNKYNNTITENTNGIHLRTCTGNSVFGNRISKNTNGIHLDRSASRNLIASCNFTNNSEYAVLQTQYSNNNKIAYNNFFTSGNKHASFVNCFFNFLNWNNNYWDDKNENLPYYLIKGRIIVVPWINIDSTPKIEPIPYPPV